jgi:hypothetical protein
MNASFMGFFPAFSGDSVLYSKLIVERMVLIQRALTLCYKLIDKCNVYATICVEMPLNLVVLKE